jgi:hypothetical protein
MTLLAFVGLTVGLKAATAAPAKATAALDKPRSNAIHASIRDDLNEFECSIHA